MYLLNWEREYIMNVLTTNLTANEIEFYKFAIEASLDCGHVTIEDIQNTGCQLTENQIKGYVGSLTKKGLIVPDYEYKSIFYVYVAFSDCDGVTATFYGENLEDGLPYVDADGVASESLAAFTIAAIYSF